MRRCYDCNKELVDDSKYCPQCGKDLSFGGDPLTITGRIDALISSAGKNQIDGKWDEAIADATNALKIDPKRGETARILAGIYEQRGMLEEASIWYRTAVELNPDSLTDQVLLDHVLEKMQTANKAKAKAHDKSGRKTILIAGMAALILVLLLIILVVNAKKNHIEDIKQPVNRSPITSMPPPITNPILTTPNRNNPAVPQSVPQNNNSFSGSSDSSATESRTAAESTIKKTLDESDYLRTSGMKIDDVIADPRDAVAVVTVSAPLSNNVNRVSIITSAGWIASLAFGSHRDLKFVTVRYVLYDSRASSSQIAFVGDVSKDAMASLQDGYNIQQLEAVFTRVWWNPAIK